MALFPWIAEYEKAGRDFTLESEFRTQALRLVTVNTSGNSVFNRFADDCKGSGESAPSEWIGCASVQIGSQTRQVSIKCSQASILGCFPSKISPLFIKLQRNYSQDAMQSVLTEKMKAITKISETDRVRAIEVAFSLE